MNTRWALYALGALGTFFVISAAAMFLMMLSLGGETRGGFLGSFQVRNDSGVAVKVTPIGMWKGSGKYGPLPAFEKGAPTDGMQKLVELPLAAGDSVRVAYDAKDLNFRHLLVRTPGGELKIVDTDRRGTLHIGYGPQSDLYVVPPLDRMEPASPELEPCTRGETVPYSKAVEYPDRKLP